MLMVLHILIKLLQLYMTEEHVWGVGCAANISAATGCHASIEQKECLICIFLTAIAHLLNVI